MAEAKTAPKTKEVAKSNEPSVPAVNLATVSMDEAIAVLEGLEEGEKDSGYFELEPGEDRRVCFMGWDTIQAIGKPKGETVPAVKLLTSTGKNQINADSVIVSYFEKQKVGCARKIVCTGKKKSDKGEYKTFDFYELNLKK